MSDTDSAASNSNMNNLDDLQYILCGHLITNKNLLVPFSCQGKKMQIICEDKANDMNEIIAAAVQERIKQNSVTQQQQQEVPTVEITDA
jgi:hypothetical protein